MMKASRRAICGLMLFAFLTGAAAPPAPGVCVTEGDVADLASVFLPDVLLAAKSACIRTLAPNAMLVQDDGALRTKYRAEVARATPGAKAALAKLVEAKVFPKVDPALAHAVVVAKLSEEIKSKDCALIERVAELMEPLPAANVAQLLALFAAQSAQADVRKGKKPWLPVCASVQP